ncbi:MAG: hypothetical protein Q7R67_00445 [bacterium]|nr:hypothetical protein [bacterium]
MTKGLTLVEVMIASTIILGAVVTLLGVYGLYFKTALSNAELVQAAYLAEAGIEEIRFLRDQSWSTNIASLTSTTTWIDNFQRTVNLSPVYRDASDDIVSSGGTLDSNTKLVTSSVSWQASGATTTRNISTYITNLYAN